MKNVFLLLCLLFGGSLPAASECQAAEAPVRPEAEAYDLTCSYTASRDAPDRSANQVDYDWDRYARCARLDPDGRVVFDPAHRERMSVEDGFASVLVDAKGWYYVGPDGASLQVLSTDFNTDPWVEGLTRGRRDGKIVFFNRQFEEATGHRYDWAWPFQEGRALVCDGCVLEDSQQEHPILAGGTWWLIDRSGERIEPEALSEDEKARLERIMRHGAMRW
jgi:hypothetical protein